MFDLKEIYDGYIFERYILNNKIQFSSTCFNGNFIYKIYDEDEKEKLKEDPYYIRKLKKLKLDNICQILDCKIISIDYIILSTSNQYFLDYRNFKLYKDNYIFEKKDEKFTVYKSEIPENEYKFINASDKYPIEESNVSSYKTFDFYYFKTKYLNRKNIKNIIIYYELYKNPDYKHNIKINIKKIIRTIDGIKNYINTPSSLNIKIEDFVHILKKYKIRYG